MQNAPPLVVKAGSCGDGFPLTSAVSLLSIDVDLCVRIYRYIPSLYCLLVLWYVGTKYHHS